VTRQPRPFAGRPGEGERLSFGGTTLIVRASAEMTGGAFTMFEESTPLLDTPRHVHRNEDKLYYVVEGEHVYQCDDEEFQVARAAWSFCLAASPMPIGGSCRGPAG
jgi:hypothetical protein